MDNGLCKVGYTWFEHWEIIANLTLRCPVTVPMRLIFVWSRAGSLQGGHIKVVTLIMPRGIYLPKGNFTFFANVLGKNNIFEAMYPFYPKNRKEIENRLFWEENRDLDFSHNRPALWHNVAISIYIVFILA